jgi:hypothetical protein
MTIAPAILGSRCLTHRATGINITSRAPIYREDWPYSTVHPQQALLRYMDFWKFEDLFKTQTLYFCRADKFDDALEGMPSPKGVQGTSRSDLAFQNTAIRVEPSYEDQLAYRAIAKGCTFVNCWHINTIDTPAMWKSYTKSNDSLLVVTTQERLEASLKQQVVMAGVKYVSSETPRTEFGDRSLFFYKDAQYSFEQEYRLLIDLLMLGGSISPDDENDFFRRVPVDLSTLIQFIQPHPEANEETRSKIETLVREHLPQAKKKEEIA